MGGVGVTPRVVLVTGGARSGKSRFSETRLAELAPGGPWLYVATAEARDDDEMKVRIARHQSRRGAAWRTVEASRDVAAVLAAPDLGAAPELRAASAAATAGVLVDCVTLWLTNLLLDGAADEALLAAADRLGAAARACPAPVVLVTNEVGAGIVPEHPLGRRFRDLAGLVNQRLAAASDEVVLVACGLPLRLR
jgi:adenosylcobinamide kinase/adenosylcobinamide-phosphate guanylyltransferase